MPDIGDTNLLEIHAVVAPTDILLKLEQHRQRYIETLGDVKKIYEARTIRYAEAYKEYTQKELKGELTEADKKARPVQPHMPANRTKKYDRYIALYGATRAEKIYLSEEHFAVFFLDEWDFIKAHIDHLRMLSSGGPVAFLNADLSAIAATALIAYSS